MGAFVAHEDINLSFESQRHQLQPLVDPHPSHTWHEPAGRIFVPQVKHIGASLSRPWNASSSSAEECTSAGALRTAAELSSGAVAGVVGADCARLSRSSSSLSTGSYDPVSS